MKQKTDKEIEQEHKVMEHWLDRWEAEHLPGEDLETCTARLNHQEKMRVLWGMMSMFEDNEANKALLEQAQQRYKYYSDLYNQGKYEF